MTEVEGGICWKGKEQISLEVRMLCANGAEAPGEVWEDFGMSHR